MIGSASNLNNPNAIIKYRDPYTCLDFRLQVQRVVDRTPKLSMQLSSFDIAAIIEAVAKRGYSNILYYVEALACLATESNKYNSVYPTTIPISSNMQSIYYKTKSRNTFIRYLSKLL